MRRVRGDGGAVAVLVALLSVVLFGFGALVIDVGALYSERRQLQNGSDAGALAVAQSCAGGSCGAFLADAENFASGNAVDKRSRVQSDEVCGLGPGLPACTDPPAGLGGSGYVRVTARTRETDGTTLVPPTLARVIVPVYNGTDVNASSTVIWGAPGGLTSAIPVTFSLCEWKKFTSDGTKLAPAPDYAVHTDLGYSTSWLKDSGSTYERTFYTHDTKAASEGVETACPASPPGGDTGGSFGWLSDEKTGTSGTCSATTTLSPSGEPGYENKPGNTVPKECKKGDFPKPGTVVYIPIYDYFTAGSDVEVDEVDKNGKTSKATGQHVWYHVAGYAVFYVTGYNLQLPQGGDEKSLVTGSFPCGGQERCMSGFFTAGLAPGTGPVVDGPSYGANITQLVF